MLRPTLSFIALSFIALVTTVITSAANPDIIVADSLTHVPLPGASVAGRHGTSIAVSDDEGRLPRLPESSYPVKVSYIGFNSRIIPAAGADTIFLSRDMSELPEIIVESRHRRILHILAYVREYDTLNTYTENISLFREKMVDFMLPADEKSSFRGWMTPRVLTSKSYYRFTDHNGLDSVSDESRHYFSWSDWIGIPPAISLPAPIRSGATDTYALEGEKAPAEIWHKTDDRVTIDIDLPVDTADSRWMPTLAGFLNRNLEFEKIKATYRYKNVVGDIVTPRDLEGYTYEIVSYGRSPDMSRIDRNDEPLFVSTKAEIYILDKEFITVKEARKWEDRRFDIDETGIYEPLDAPGLPPSTLALIDRVANIDKDSIRLDYRPNYRITDINRSRKNFRIGNRALMLLKELTGITLYRSHKNFNNNWDSFRKEHRGKRKSK